MDDVTALFCQNSLGPFHLHCPDQVQLLVLLTAAESPTTQEPLIQDQFIEVTLILDQFIQGALIQHPGAKSIYIECLNLSMTCLNLSYGLILHPPEAVYDLLDSVPPPTAQTVFPVQTEEGLLLQVLLL